MPELRGAPTVVVESASADQHLSEAASGETEDREDNAVTSSSPVKADDDAPTNTEHATSMTSAQTSGSAWYSPWSWYEWYSAPAPVKTPEEPNAAKTAAELIKEEALSRATATEPQPTLFSEQPSDPSSSQAPTLTPGKPPEAANPILSSFAANPSGWTSFFSSRSRSLTTKAVTEAGERSDRESMEVMDIDDFDEGSVSEAKESHVKPSQTVGDGKAAIKNAKEMDGLPKSSDSAVHAPLTTVEDVRRKAVSNQSETRSSSPTPSKKSAKSVPASPAPRPANLVLPTFEDTFFTPPRSQPPPKSRSSASSAFRKTMGFVSSVLFAREEDESSGKRKGKQKERHPDLELFGKELPRAWKVLGDVPEHCAFSECKKVVVIGVHGWFPGMILICYKSISNLTEQLIYHRLCYADSTWRGRVINTLS